MWHLGTDFATSQRAPTNRHWASAVTTTISPCCKASIWGSSSCRAHQLLAKLKEASRVNRPTAEVPTLPEPVKYKSPLEDPTKFLTWAANTLHSFLTLPSLANTCSCLPQAHCQFLSTVWLKGLHRTQREGQGQCSPARPQPVVSETEGCQRQAQEAAAVQGVHLPIRDSTGLPTSCLTSPSPKRIKKTHQNVRFEQAAPTQTAYHLYTSWCISPDWNLCNASQLGGKEEPPKLSFVTIEMYPNVSSFK